MELRHNGAWYHISPWVFSLGQEVKILGPENVVEQMKEEIRRLKQQYNLSHSNQNFML